MEEAVREQKTKTVSLSAQRLKQFEVVLAIVSVAGFAWLLILLANVLTTPAIIVEYPSVDPRSGVWIQGVQFSQLVMAFALSGLFGVFRTVKWVVQELQKAVS